VKVERLLGPIRSYAWGSHRFIAELQGRHAPTSAPEAELWLGAHPGAPSEIESTGQRLSLLDLIDTDRSRALGPALNRRFDGELPFLMKVLAAERPLSLQAHPSRAQAEAGFAREQAKKVPLSAPERSYKDKRPKPELIVALTPFSALSGFRRPSATQALFRELDAPSLEPFLKPLADPNPKAALATTFEGLMTADADVQRTLARATLDAATRKAGSGGAFEKEFAWAARLGALYPGDIGITCALLLNLVELSPYEGMFLPAGNLHAYLEGAGIEIMAASDNVLRGGLTPKPVNVPELLRVLDFSELAPAVLLPKTHSEGEHVYPTPSEEFRLSYLEVEVDARVEARKSPEILLVTAGELSLESSTGALALNPGDAAFVPACEPSYVLRGSGTVFRATAGEATN
jgi:mannose-6-phosphate isomerase